MTGVGHLATSGLLLIMCSCLFQYGRAGYRPGVAGFRRVALAFLSVLVSVVVLVAATRWASE